MKAYTPPADGMFSKILVPTVDVVRSTWLLSTTVGAGRPCLFVGESGTAKTATIQHYLGTWTANNNVVLNMNFSSRTSSSDVQRAIEVLPSRMCACVTGMLWLVLIDEQLKGWTRRVSELMHLMMPITEVSFSFTCCL